MILTPKELLNWIKAGKTFSVVDLRPKQLKSKDRLLGMQGRLSNSNIIPAVKNDLVLICQFGIVTEGLILEKKLTNTYSLLGGSEAWNHFYKNDFDFSKYSRQIILPEIGLDGQNKIINSKIAIIGMGGLGCPASQSLVAAGVGHLKIIDGDKVEISNLHRQPLYNCEDIGYSKVFVSKNKLKKQNKNTVIEPFDCFFDISNAEKILNDVDVIIDATDNYVSRIKIDNASKRLNIPMIYGGLHRYEGHVSIFNFNNGPSYVDIFPKPNENEDNCNMAGTLGMLTGIIGNIQALEAIKIVTGIDNNLSGKLLIYNTLSHELTKIEL